MLKTSTSTIIKGESVIDDKVIVSFNATIDHSKPEDINFSHYQRDKSAYKDHHAECLKDQAEFEAIAYAEQDKILARQTAIEKE